MEELRRMETGWSCSNSCAPITSLRSPHMVNRWKSCCAHLSEASATGDLIRLLGGAYSRCRHYLLLPRLPTSRPVCQLLSFSNKFSTASSAESGKAPTKQSRKNAKSRAVPRVQATNFE